MPDTVRVDINTTLRNTRVDDAGDAKYQNLAIPESQPDMSLSACLFSSKLDISAQKLLTETASCLMICQGDADSTEVHPYGGVEAACSNVYSLPLFLYP